MTYVGFRLFCDRFVNEDDRNAFREIIMNVMEYEWNCSDLVNGIEDVYFVADESRKYLSKIEKRDWTEIVNKGILATLGKVRL